jgi:hypothetical protein
MNNLEQGFRLLAVSTALSYGYGFSPNSQHLINEIIRDGVNTLRAQGEPPPDVVHQAQDDLVRLVFNLVTEAQSSNTSEIQENIVAKIKKLLCPLPPWLKAPCP